MDPLFSVDYLYLYAKLLVDVFAEMLCAVDTAVLSSCAAEAEHKGGEAALDIATNMCVGQLIHTVEEGGDLTVVFKEAYHGFVEPGEFLVWFVSSGIVGATAVEHVSTAIARGVVGYSLPVGEAVDTHYEGSAAVVLREGGGSVLRMGLIYVFLCHFEAISTVDGGLFYACKLRHLGKSP